MQKTAGTNLWLDVDFNLEYLKLKYFLGLEKWLSQLLRVHPVLAEDPSSVSSIDVGKLTTHCL